MERVFTNGELNAHAEERPLQVVIGLLHVLLGDIYRVRVQFRQDGRHGLLHKVVYVDRIHILVINNMQQVIQLIAARVDDTKAVA